MPLGTTESAVGVVVRERLVGFDAFGMESSGVVDHVLSLGHGDILFAGTVFTAGFRACGSNYYRSLRVGGHTYQPIRILDPRSSE